MQFEIEQRGRDYWAQTAGDDPFFVGRRVRYGDRIGLCNVFSGSPLSSFVYQADNYRPDFGIWSAVIAPTAACEGGNFLAFNSYDRATFTFGFTQFGAHVPDGDFVRLFHTLLEQEAAADYFPMLRLKDGRVHLAQEDDAISLEGPSSTTRLCDWLNPSSATIDPEEVQAAARLIHLTRTSRLARLAQIAQTIASFAAYLRRAGRSVPMDGRPAAHCCVIADLLHHGRGGRQVWAAIGQALSAPAPLDALLAIGAAAWPERRATLRREILGRPDLARWRWNSSRAEFD